jgi:hypothetical protein
MVVVGKASMGSSVWDLGGYLFPPHIYFLVPLAISSMKIIFLDKPSKHSLFSTIDPWLI